MSQLPDLVRDSKLDTDFKDGSFIHKRFETIPGSRTRPVLTREYWQRRSRRPIGGGSFGTVWLETCVKGPRHSELRAVKEIQKLGNDKSRRPIDYNRELDAISKFSQHKVSDTTAFTGLH